MPEPAMEEHEGKKGEDLFGKGKVDGDIWDGVPGRDETVEEDKLIQVRLPGQLNEIDSDAEGDETVIDDGDGPGLGSVSKRDHGFSFQDLHVSEGRRNHNPISYTCRRGKNQ